MVSRRLPLALLSLLPISLILILAPTPAGAADPRCLTKAEERAAIASGEAVRLAVAARAARRAFRGEVVRARLCYRGPQLIYVLTLLSRDGKVRRLRLDAGSGRVIGGR